MQTTGSDLNAGSTTADAAAYTSTGGNFDGTSVFTPTDGSTPSSSISVNDYVSLYNTGDAVSRCVAKVTAVGAGVNGTVTVSTTVKYGTMPTSNSGSRALKAGGAWASLAMVATNGALNTGTVPQSTRINIKAGTYANTTTVRTLAMVGTVTAPLWWRGYNAVIGDQDTNNVAVAGTDIPAITFTTGNLAVSGTHQVFSNLDVTAASTTAATLAVSTGQTQWYRVRSAGTAAAATGRALQITGNVNAFVGCNFSATSTPNGAVFINSTNNKLIGCTVKGGTNTILVSTGPALIFGCIISSSGADAIATSVPVDIINCSIYSPVGNGINFTTVSALSSLVANCYFENVNQASKAAINNTTGTNTDLIRLVANGYYNCTTNLAGITESFAVFDNGTLGSAAFTSPGTEDFSIGAVARSLGFPGAFENISTYQGYLDLGAVQSPMPAVGSNVINHIINRYYYSEQDP